MGLRIQAGPQFVALLWGKEKKGEGRMNKERLVKWIQSHGFQAWLDDEQYIKVKIPYTFEGKLDYTIETVHDWQDARIALGY